MNMKNFYHIFANGSDARNFITSRSDMEYQFNLVAVSALSSGAAVIAFSIEDTHPHILVYGEETECRKYLETYEMSTKRHIARTRGDMDSTEFSLTMYLVESPDYLKNVASYIIVQPTKDGKRIMPYDYFWGSGSLYFRTGRHIPLWLRDDNGNLLEARKYADIPIGERRQITRSSVVIPDGWLICQHLILPENYVKVQLFEEIYGTPNCFRAFSAAGRKSMENVMDTMARNRGVIVDDLEARNIMKSLCRELYGKDTARTLGLDERLVVARELGRRYRLSRRQIAILVRLPKSEVEKYL